MSESKLYDFTMTSINGIPMPLADYQGKPVLLVNVASRCGLTPQYEGLQALYQKYQERGLVILGLPCNQFAGQEPGTESDIQQFCSMNYSVTFPMTSKIAVNGKERHPLYQWLAGDDAKYPGDISWNFEKFLIDKHGEVAARFSPRTEPEADDVIEAVERVL